MKYTFTFLKIIFLIQILVFHISIAHCVEIDSTSHTLLLKGLHQVHIEDYNQALVTFKKLINHHPQHPVGYFCSAAVYKTIMQNYHIKDCESQLDSLLNLTIDIGNKAIKNAQHDMFASIYLGGAYGFRGLHKVRKRDYWGAFKDGLKGVSILKKAIKADSTVYDAFYGLGSFHYWRSAKSKLLRFLIYRKDQQKGIDEVWKSIKKGTYTDIEGKYALAAIYYDYGEYEKAFSVNQELFELFPTNPSCLYMRCRIFEKQGKWDEAKQTYFTLLNHLLNSEYKSIGYLVECYYGIGLCHYKLGEFEQASKHIKKALDLRKKRDASKELEGPLEDFDEIIENAVTLYGRLVHENVSKE